MRCHPLPPLFYAGVDEIGEPNTGPAWGLHRNTILGVGDAREIGRAIGFALTRKDFIDARTGRRSLLYATGIIGFVGLLLFIIGFGAMALVGSDVIRGVDRGGNMAVPPLAERVGGTAFLGFVAAVSFATILAVVSGLVITGAATLSHDLWTHAVRGGVASECEQMVVAKLAVAASANFPALVLSIFWRRLTTPGAAAFCVTILVSLVTPRQDTRERNALIEWQMLMGRTDAR